MKSDPIFTVWPIAPFGGTSPDAGANTTTTDAGANSGAANGQAAQGNSGTGASNSTQANSTTTTTAKDDDDDDPYAGLSAKELRRLLADTESKATTNEAAAKALQDKIDEEERKKRSEIDNVKTDLQTEKDANATLRATNAKLAIINAINADGRYQWHNPEIVAQQLDSKVVKVDDNGKVSGIEKELGRLAKDEGFKFLLKATNDQGTQQNNGNQNGNQNSGPTGVQPGQGGANQGGTLPPNAADLSKTFPALASRL